MKCLFKKTLTKISTKTSGKSQLGETFRFELDEPKHSETLLILKMNAYYTTKKPTKRLFDFSQF